MTITIQFIKDTFNEFNKTYFAGLLTEPNFRVSSTKAFGSYNFAKNEISISRYYDRIKRDVEQTLLHEMIHLWEYKMFGKCAHGANFKAKAKEINAVGGWNIATHSSLNGAEISEAMLKDVDIVVGRVCNHYYVGRVRGKCADTVCKFIRDRNYFQSSVRYKAKGSFVQSIPANVKNNFHYIELTETEFYNNVYPYITEQVPMFKGSNLGSL